jgi:hypothetical protein
MILIQKRPDFDELTDALNIINNWRTSHSFPLNTFQIWLKSRTRDAEGALIAQRIKRLSSIHLKLSRFSSIRLSQMQDIGGCRAVLGDVNQVYAMLESYKSSDLKHKLDHIDDYISRPKVSGYRGIHLIYRYLSDRNTTYNGLKIEVQLRSTLQHAWATAVETVGTFTRQALKSSLGEADWLRFFALMGTAIALREKTAPVPDTFSDPATLQQELREYSQRLNVAGHLSTYGMALQAVEESSAKKRRAHYFLLELDVAAKNLRIAGYMQNELPQASTDYLKAEKKMTETGGGDAVLVSVDSVSALRRAYPNYFMDTHVFIDALHQALT